MNHAKNGHAKIDKISIESFRHFKDVEFSISENITLIGGQNGTSKSTLLGMLCQPFSFGFHTGSAAGSKDNSKYTNNYHGIDLSKYLDITGSPFFYDCEDVFRLSTKHDTLEKKYKYQLHLSGDLINRDSPVFEDGISIRARKRPNTQSIRFVTSPGSVASHAKGEGNFPHPVVYLGLNRLWPLALLKNLDVEDTTEITKEDKEWYIEKYNDILILGEHKNNTELLKTGERSKRDHIGVSSDHYNSESCSAGQDNIGQILTAILSFKHLKSKLGDKYQGGLLLIDELDATLHAKAKERLIETLFDISQELNIQIVATTHSIYLFEYIFHSKFKKKISVLYLKKIGNKIKGSCPKTFDEIKDNLTVNATPLSKKK